MRRLWLTTALLLPAFLLATAESPQKGAPKYDVKKCTPKLVTKKSVSEPKTFKIRKTDKPTGYDPLIAFEILESGEVVNARLARGSGMADRDAHALASIRRSKFSHRPGCGTIESTAAVTIDLR